MLILSSEYRMVMFAKRLAVLLTFVSLSILAQESEESVQPSDSSGFILRFDLNRYVFPEPEAEIAFRLGQMTQDSTVFVLRNPALVREVVYDTSNYTLTFQYADLAGNVVRPPRIYTIDEYKEKRLKENQYELFVAENKKLIDKELPGGGGGFVFKVPWEIKSKTFQRLFGSGDVSLKVTGNISFSLSGRLESREGSAISSIQENNTFRPKFKQTQRFNIEGKIGEKVRIEVQQNSQATFDLENNLKVTYTGYEEEILQKLEAGNIDLSLPRTNYVTFSGKNKGLFGIKALMKFGNLDVTAIASLEKGEKQKLTVTNGRGEAKEITKKEFDYVKNTFFFVDKIYKDNWGNFDTTQTTLTLPAIGAIEYIEVYRSLRGAQEGGIPGVAYYDVDTNAPDWVNPDTASQELGRIETAQFRLLDQQQEGEAGGDFELNQDRGYIRLFQPMSENEVLALHFTTTRGNIFGESQAQFLADSASGRQRMRLMLIKGANPKADTARYIGKTWELMMRNVYSLDGNNIDEDALKFTIRLYNENNRETDNQGKTFLNLTGLDRWNSSDGFIREGDNNPDLSNPQIFDLENGYVFFPDLRPFDPIKDLYSYSDDFYIRDYTNDSTWTSMYEILPSNRTKLLDISAFELAFETGQTVKQTEFDLGFNVLAGSESVKLNGRELVRDKDYTIDYFSGRLSLTTADAQREGADIDIEYEQGSIFQLDEKTLFGVNAQYNIDDKSFIGFTGMFLNKSSIEQRVRVGQEPFRNFVWDLNMALQFRPKFVTQALNFLPYVDTQTPSEFNIETEYAQVLPNPNTQNNAGTGDNEGVAYIDDFESSRRSATLSVLYRPWVSSSVPALFMGDDITTEENIKRVDKYRPQYVWYNPFNRVNITQIWPERDINSNTDQKTDVLDISWKQRPENAASWDSSWVGIMRSTTSFANQQETKYIELWVELQDEDLAAAGTKMHIDIGTISEDWYIGETGYEVFNSEDLIPKVSERNDLLDDGEDLGIDMIKNGEPGDDPEDAWVKLESGSGADYFPFGFNGTEGNGNAQGTRYPDTEDLDNDGNHNLANDYFSYEVRLDPDHPAASEYFISETVGKVDIDGVQINVPTGWYQIRIPLNDFVAKVGSPDETFSQMFYYRLWLSNLPQDEELHKIRIAAMDYVQNEWNELGIARNDSTNAQKDDDLFNILVYNTEENSTNITPGTIGYKPPKGVSGVEDPVTNIRSKEQSLVFRFEDLPPGQSVIGKKNIYESFNISNYKRLKMFIHGDHKLDILDEHLQGRKLEFIMKIGKDDKNYYEYHQPIYPFWDDGSRGEAALNRNNLDLSIAELSASSLEPGTIFRLDDKEGAWFRAIGRPSIRQVRYLTFAVKNVDPDPRSQPFTGEVWFNEFRVSDVDKTPGSAMRVKTVLKAADIFSVIANVESKDANFHTINEQNARGFASGNLNYTQRQDLTFNIDLGRFLPESAALTINTTAKISESASIPKYFPQSDKLTGYTVDNFGDRLLTLIGNKEREREVDSVSAINSNRSFGASLRRNARKKHWYTEYTIDPLTVDVDYGIRKSRDDKKEFSVAKTFSNKFAYRFPWGRNNYVRPFAWSKKIPVVNNLADVRLYYAPSKTDLNASISHQDTRSKLRTQTETPEPDIRTSTVRVVDVEYKIFDELSVQGRRTYNAKVDHLNWTLDELYENIFTNLNFGENSDIKQTGQLSFNPKLSRYFSAGYSASSNYNLQTKVSTTPRQRNSGNSFGQRFKFSMKPNQLLRLIYEPEKASTGNNRGGADTNNRRRRRGSGSGSGTPKEKDKEEDKKESATEEKTDDKKGISIPNPLMLFYHMFDSWKEIKVDYNTTRTSTHTLLQETPSFGYQFGITRRAIQYDTLGTLDIREPIFKDDNALNASIGLDVARNVQTSVDYKWANSRSWGQTLPRENTSQSYFALMSKAEEANSSGLPLPNWNVTISGIEKLPLMDLFAKTATISHSRTGDLKEDVTENEGGQGKVVSKSNSFSPLLGIRISFKNGISFDARYNIAQNYSNSNELTQNWSEKTDMTFQMSYSTKGGFRIPIPIFGLDEKRFKNQMDFSLSFSLGDQLRRSFETDFTLGEKRWTERENSSNWSLKPAVNFQFARNIRGSVFYQQSVNQTKLSGKTTIKEFGINVSLDIRE
jgi:hypothetical protein